MSDCKFAELSDRAIIKITGSDSEIFLKGLITNDVGSLSNDSAGGAPPTCFAGLLTPQGKILFDFFVVYANGVHYLDSRADNADELIKRLTFYKLRADVEIVKLDDTHCAAVIWNGNEKIFRDGICYADPRLEALGMRCIRELGTPPPEGCILADDADYHAHRISHTVPEGGQDYPLGDSFPHEACYDLLHGIDFRKGCFVGQEVVSRMQHRGTARKRIIAVSASTKLPPIGTEILADDKPIGILGSSSNTNAIALIRLDRAARALENNYDMTAAGIPVRLKKPSWADYDIT